MAQIRPNSFSSFDLTAQEQEQGYSLNTYQRMVIQNQISAAAEEKIALKYDPANPLQFVQQEAELQGRILALQFLLEQSSYLEINSVIQPQE